MDNRTAARTSPDLTTRLLQHPFAMYGLLGLLTVFLTISYAPGEYDAYKHAYGDATRYLIMAQKPLSPVHNPFALRILTPLLAQYLMRWFGLSPDLAFAGLNAAFTWGFLALFYRLGREYARLSAFVAFFCTLMLAFTFWYTLFNLQDIWLVDPLNNLMILTGIYLGVRQKFWLWLPLMMVGFVNKEVALYSAPVYPMMAYLRSGSFKNREVIRGLAGLVVLGAVYIGYRLILERIIAGANYVYHPLRGEYNQPILQVIRFNLTGERRMFEIFKIFGYLWIVAAVFPFIRWNDARKASIANEIKLMLLYFLVLLFASRFLAYDSQRVLGMMTPVAILAAGFIFQSLFKGERALFMPVIACCYIGSSIQLGTPDTILLLNIAALILMAIAWRQQKDMAIVQVADPEA